MPRHLLAQSLSEYRRKRGREGDIFWTSWRYLPGILERSRQEECQPEQGAVLEDMLKLLLRKGLVMFRGVEPIEADFKVPEFYHSTPTRYAWPNITESWTILYEFEVAK